MGRVSSQLPPAPILPSVVFIGLPSCIRPKGGGGLGGVGSGTGRDVEMSRDVDISVVGGRPGETR